MKTTLAESVARIMKTYNDPKNYKALVQAIEGLVQTHVELRDARGEKELAETACTVKPRHKDSRVACGTCFNLIANPQTGEGADGV